VYLVNNYHTDHKELALSYKHLSLTDRHYIEIERKGGATMSEIAIKINRPQSTISREISRNTGGRGYRHKQAHKFTADRHRDKNKSVKLTPELISVIIKYLKKDYSPEQISGRLKLDGQNFVHYETIYQYILADKRNGGDLYTHLRHKNKTYRKRYGSAHNRNGIKDRVDIDERPEVANNRERVGDWEMDTIIGKNHKGAIVTMDDRKTKLRLAYPVPGKKAEDVKNAIIKLLSPIKSWVKTNTYDNGKEFAFHKKVSKALGSNAYFAKPYHSWERGQNENANGLLRQYFPKSMELVNIPISDVFAAVHKLNSRPRKCLGFKTPYEVFENLTGINMKELKCYALMT
jgi:transposase, IS30 family